MHICAIIFRGGELVSSIAWNNFSGEWDVDDSGHHEWRAFNANLGPLERLRISRTSGWDVRFPFGLSPKVIVEENPASRGITSVDFSLVNLVPCRDRRGNPVRAIDMVHRYAQFADIRSKILKNLAQMLIMRAMFKDFGADKLVPLDAILYAYCHEKFAVLDKLCDRLGRKNPHFFLHGTLICYPSWEQPSVIEIYRGYMGMYLGQLSPANAVHGENDFSLAVG